MILFKTTFYLHEKSCDRLLVVKHLNLLYFQLPRLSDGTHTLRGWSTPSTSVSNLVSKPFMRELFEWKPVVLICLVNCIMVTVIIAYMNVLIQVVSIPNVVLLLANFCREIDHLKCSSQEDKTQDYEMKTDPAPQNLF